MSLLDESTQERVLTALERAASRIGHDFATHRSFATRIVEILNRAGFTIIPKNETATEYQKADISMRTALMWEGADWGTPASVLWAAEGVLERLRQAKKNLESARADLAFHVQAHSLELHDQGNAPEGWTFIDETCLLIWQRYERDLLLQAYRCTDGWGYGWGLYREADQLAGGEASCYLHGIQKVEKALKEYLDGQS